MGQGSAAAEELRWGRVRLRLRSSRHREHAQSRQPAEGEASAASVHTALHQPLQQLDASVAARSPCASAAARRHLSCS